MELLAGSLPVTPEVAGKAILVGSPHPPRPLSQFTAFCQQLIDAYPAGAAVGSNMIDQAQLERVRDGLPCRLADEDSRAVAPVERFQAAGKVHRIADGRVGDPA